MPNSNKFTSPTNLPISGTDYDSPQEGFISSDRMYKEPKLENLSDVNWITGSPVLPDNGLYDRSTGNKQTKVSIVSRPHNGTYTAIKPIPHEEPAPPPPEVWIDVTGPEFWEDYYKDDIFWDYSNYEWDSGNERWRLTEPSTTATAAVLRPINGWEIGLRFSRFRITLNSGTNINSGILSEGTEVGLRTTGPDITNDKEAVFSNWNEEVVLELTIKTDVDFDLSRLGMDTYLYNDGPYITKIEYQPI